MYERMAKLDRLPWPSLEAVLAAARAFLDPPLGGNAGTWDPKLARWT